MTPESESSIFLVKHRPLSVASPTLGISLRCPSGPVENIFQGMLAVRMDLPKTFLKVFCCPSGRLNRPDLLALSFARGRPPSFFHLVSVFVLLSRYPQICSTKHSVCQCAIYSDLRLGGAASNVK